MVIILTDKQKRRFVSLRWILLIVFLLIAIVPLMILAQGTFRSMNAYFVEEQGRELINQANVISGQLVSADYFSKDSDKKTVEATMLESSQSADYRVLVLDESCMVVYDTSYRDVGKTYLLPETLEALKGKDIVRAQDNGGIYAAASVMGEGNQVQGVVLISALADDVQSTLVAIEQQVLLIIFAIFITLIFTMFLISHLFTDPLKRIIEVIKKMSQGHLEQRVEIRDGMINTEITDLALACNNMADQLERVETTRQEFVSNVSHELKTPLSSMKVLSESILLQEDAPKEMYLEFLQDINSEVNRMTDIINDLLTLVKLDQKEVPITFAETSVNQILTELHKRLLPLANAKNISLQLSLLKDVTAQIDSMKVSLALNNLVDNAIKYTPEGGAVQVTLDADHQNFFVTVTDNGIGIPEDEVGRIFDRFYRVDKTRDRQTGGTGLGLSITHSAVMIHNGSIKVNSKENEGTSILVRIPLRQA